MNELLYPLHAAGGTSGGSPEVSFNIPFNQFDTGNGSAFASLRITRTDYLGFNVPSAGSGAPLPLLAAVTGSGTNQDVNIPTTGFMKTTLATLLIINGGASNQEVVVGTITDSTHFNAVCLNNHIVGEPVLMVYSCLTKYLLVDHGGTTPFSLTNIGFIRYGNLLANVYDQYRVLGSVGTLDYEVDTYLPWVSGIAPSATVPLPRVPQYDPASVSSTGNPTNAAVIAPGPITATYGLYPNVQLQLLFTSIPEPDSSFLDYRYYWDH
jgi:hypothetical protein